MLRRTLSMMLVLAASSVAQTASTPTKTTAPAKNAPVAATKSTSAPTKPASQAVTTPTATKPTTKASAPAKHIAAKPTTAPSKAAIPAKAQVAPAKPNAAKAALTKTAGRRDPFVSPLRIQEDRIKQSSLCTTGARCLIIEQVELKGIVKTQQGMIAMVENAAKKQYNLREKDPVLNGQVIKITGDSLIFKETVTDNLGNQTTKEVVKKVTAPVI